MYKQSEEKVVFEQHNRVDPFWEAFEQNLIKAVSFYISSGVSGEQHNLRNLLSDKSLESKLDAFFADVDENHEAKIAYERYKQANRAIRECAIAGIVMRQIN